MRTAKLFQNGQSQAVRLPKEFRFQGKEVYVKRMGNAVILLPMDRWLDNWFENLGRFSDDFMEERNQPPMQTRESLFDL